jgi:hypothetical protein
MLACQEGHRDVAELLLDRGADVGQAKQDGTTALILACEKGHRDVAELLLDRGADVGQADENGMTALMWACQKGHLDVATLLFEKSADANQAMDNTVTPLMCASHFGHLPCVEALLSHGAVALTVMTGDNVVLGAGPGATALSLATTAGHEDIVAILVDIVALYAWMTPMGLDAYVPAMVGAGIASVAAAKGVPAEMISGWAGQVGLSTKQEQALLAAAASPGAGTREAAEADEAGS